MGYRFRLNRRDPPGKPDIVLPRLRAAIFVNGCFWHRHRGCRYAYTPKTNVTFWVAKFDANVKRDAHVRQLLKRLGWKAITIWECETKDLTGLEPTIVKRMSRAVRGTV